ncbi:MAG: PAS-domain containing protein [Rhodocyclaceae bacterium]|nr:PAS-domain containing protein [Rhodocyclaceae bacterium]
MSTALSDDLLAEHHRYEMLQAGLDLLMEGITVFDRDLRMVAWNEPFLQLLDFPKGMAYAGAPFESFIRYNARRGEYGSGDVEAQVAERVQAAHTFSSHVSERVRPNGRVLLVRGEPLPHKGFVTLYADVTEQRYIENLIQRQNADLEERVRRRTAQLENANANLSRASEENARIATALRRSEERLRLINDTIPTLIGYFDHREVFQYANKGYADRFQPNGGTVTGRSIRDVVGMEVYSQVREKVREALGGRHVTYEYGMTRNGARHYARSTLVPEFGPDGETLGCFVFSYDITEQKRMQTALVQAQKMEAIGQLTGGLAHDFNNLLTVVIGNLAALRDHRPDDPALAEFIDPALQSARRGVQLIKRLLSFSRQQPLDPVSVEAGGLIRDMMVLIRRSMPESIALASELPPEPIHLVADPAQLESALLNCALNARDAMPDGGRLRIAAAPVFLDGEAAVFHDVPPGRYVRIEVADTGTGMDEATLARVFEPFFTTKRFGTGSGLGLSMVYGFVRQSAGGIRILSRPGGGSTVSIVLPEGQPGDADDAPPDQDGAAGGRLVLLVEDDQEVRRVVRQQLVDLGHPVVEAEDGVQALALAEQVADIAVLVSDVVMPGGMDGWQLAERVAAIRPEMQVVLMSGYAEGPAGAPAAGGGEAVRAPVLAKPFEARELARALQAAKPAGQWGGGR